MFKRHLINTFTLFALLSTICSGKVTALNEKQFSVDYDITYFIQENGATRVEQRVTLTNLKNEVVPTNYSFSTINTKIIDISAESNGKKVTVETNSDDKESGFTVPIVNQSIGKGKQNEIVVIYTTDSFLVKTGDVWNIYIPKIQIPENTEIYNVKIQVPKKLGPKMYFSPTPANEKDNESETIYFLTKNTFKGTGISAAFGKSQRINFKIKYQLENKNIIPAFIKIPLPPDIKNYQQVAYLNLEPKPLKVKAGQDNNFYAFYYVGPKKRVEAVLTGSSKIATIQINPDYGGNFSAIPKELLQRYTGEEKYWQTKTKKITETANNLKNPNLNVVRNAQLAYQYVVDNLEYDFDAIKRESVERYGSEAALTKKGVWTCMEFTDLFIALTRAMGIPSREVDGYAFNTGEKNKPLSLNIHESDLLHAWAEFYDPNFGWVQVDPTWGATSGIDYFSKLDTNRIAFSTRGEDSEHPLPAGSYRFNNSSKMIEIDYSLDENTNLFKAAFEVEKKITLNPIQLIKGNRKYLIKNGGNVFLYSDENNPIPPGQKKVVYLPKNSKRVQLKTIDGTDLKMDL